MRTLAWLVVIAALAGIGYYLWRLRRNWIERQRDAEQRLSSLLVSSQKPLAAAPAPVEATGLHVQKLLFDAAAKAGEAGEPALAIQLYARLLARYPDCPFAGEARAAVEVQKKKVAAS